MSSAIPLATYHNPACGTSRNVLAPIRNAGIEPTVIEYLQTPPDRATLRRLVALTDQPRRELLRENGASDAQLGSGDEHWTDTERLDQMLAQPILINRPLVATALKAKLCRPSAIVLGLLPAPQRVRQGRWRGGYSRHRPARPLNIPRTAAPQPYSTP